jgi:hypothetical protein
MPKYQCPECEAILKRDTPVEEGKKIKCPKCELIFKAKAMRETKEELEEEEKKKAAAAAAQKKAAAATDDDEEVGGSYGIIKEEKGEGDSQLKKDLYFGSLRDKFEKSKRGPAMAETVRPSNFVLMQGFFDCAGGITLVIVGLWPFIFSEEPPTGTAARNRIFMIVGGVLLFGLGCVICYGASKLQDLESYNWAMTGCILAAISIVPTGAAGGIWGIVVLKDEDVIAGFEETADKKHDY